MNRRMLVGMLLLSLAWQGPALAYLTSPTGPMSTDSAMIQCAAGQLPNGNSCDNCCSHNSGACTIACALSLGAAAPPISAPAVV